MNETSPAKPYRIGVLTSGGDAPGLNAVIRAVVKAANLMHGWEVMGIEHGFEGLAADPPHARLLDTNAVRGILSRGGTVLGTSTRSTDLVQRELTPDGERFHCSPLLLERLHGLGIRALVVIGGDGSLRIANEVAKMGFPTIGVPKTIDNDILATDYTFGFDTALDVACDALDRLHTTAESHHRVMILEVMGRDAGWIALYAGVAGGADAILIPERPYDVQAVAKAIEARYSKGRGFSIVVIAEGATPIGGQPIYQPVRDPRVRPRLGGIGEYLAEQLRELLAYEVRTTVLGYVQRGGSPTAFDRQLATRLGAEAVRLIARQEFGRMVTLRGEQVTSVPLVAAASPQPKRVAPDNDLLLAAQEIGICLG